MDINMMGLTPNLVMIFSPIPGFGGAVVVPCGFSSPSAVGPTPCFSSSTKVGAFRSTSSGSPLMKFSSRATPCDGEEDEEASRSSRAAVGPGDSMSALFSGGGVRSADMALTADTLWVSLSLSLSLVGQSCQVE